VRKKKGEGIPDPHGPSSKRKNVREGEAERSLTVESPAPSYQRKGMGGNIFPSKPKAGANAHREDETERIKSVPSLFPEEEGEKEGRERSGIEKRAGPSRWRGGRTFSERPIALGSAMSYRLTREVVKGREKEKDG